MLTPDMAVRAIGQFAEDSNSKKSNPTKAQLARQLFDTRQALRGMVHMASAMHEDLGAWARSEREVAYVRDAYACLPERATDKPPPEPDPPAKQRRSVWGRDAR